MQVSRNSRIFFYLLMLLVTVLLIYLIRPYLGAIVLAITLSFVLQPLYDFFYRRVGQRRPIATVLTMLVTIAAVVIPLLIGSFLLVESVAELSRDLVELERTQGQIITQRLTQLTESFNRLLGVEQIQISTTDVTEMLRTSARELGISLTHRLTRMNFSTFALVTPFIVFFSLLGSLLPNHERLVGLIKSISPMDDTIDQLFLDRLSIMTNAMFKSIVIIAVVQGVVTGLLLAIGRTPHLIPLTLLAVILAILPYGAALVAVPVGLVHLLVGNTWQGALIVLGSVTFVAALDNQLRPLLVSKDAYLNRAFVLLSVFSGITLFGYLGVVYGPLVMILFSTTLEVYLKYYRLDA